MTLGVIPEFDFFPFYIKVPDDWRKFYVYLSHVRTVLQSGELDAVPYPYFLLSFLPENYTPTDLAVILTQKSKSLLVISKEKIEDFENPTIGIVQGYEPVLYMVENEIISLLSGKPFKVKIFPDIFNADMFVVYGDRALRGEFGEYRYVYNILRNETPLAVWVVKKEKFDDIVPHIGNSLAHWFMNTGKYIKMYARDKKIDEKVLFEHAMSLRFKYEG